MSQTKLKRLLESQIICDVENDVSRAKITTKSFYNVPDSLHEDYEFFSRGQFSKISHTSRERIITVFGLKYNVPAGT